MASAHSRKERSYNCKDIVEFTDLKRTSMWSMHDHACSAFTPDEQRHDIQPAAVSSHSRHANALPLLFGMWNRTFFWLIQAIMGLSDKLLSIGRHVASVFWSWTTSELFPYVLCSTERNTTNDYLEVRYLLNRLGRKCPLGGVSPSLWTLNCDRLWLILCRVESPSGNGSCRLLPSNVKILQHVAPRAT